jgi:DNA recombination protein RmuC
MAARRAAGIASLAVLITLLVIVLLLRKPVQPPRLAVRNCWPPVNGVERELRREIAESSRGARQEMTHTLATFQDAVVKQGAEATRTQNTQIDAFAQQLALLQKSLSDTLTHQLQDLSEQNARRMAEVRATLEAQLSILQQTNTAKLDEMRKTVDEKLQTTLETRLGESFKQVAERLEQVHKGLGEMQSLAQGVGDLQRVLTNVKTRGMFGEVQLEALLEQVLTPEQYGRQVETKPHSNQRVDFAIKFPGRSSDGTPVWLPIDAKFPREDYERLLDAHDRADAGGRRKCRPGAGGAHPPGGQVDLRVLPRPAAHHRLRHPVPADRKPVRRGAAASGTDGPPAA